ncbi:hypothetical protein BASA81_002532 [Batrachochytrium salamandrivorans]|nr:hypothetical protein BASA81_002532 [Batrachochytrium salamandrivorans]
MLASKLFEERHRGSLQQSVKSRLDSIQAEYKVKPEAVLVAWDCLQLAKPLSQHGSQNADWPETEDSFQLLKRKLGEMVAKDAAKKSVNLLSTVQSKFIPQISPAQVGEKRPEFSTQSAPKRPQFAPVVMERLLTVQPFLGGHFAMASEGDVNETRVQVLPSNEWTERWFVGNKEHRYMYAPLTGITEELRHRITQFGQRVLESQRVKNPLIGLGEEGEGGELFCTSFDKVGAAVQGRNVVVCGWVVCEGENEKLGLGNCMLEGVNGVRVKLELQDAGKCSLFPGQYLVVEGVSTMRTKLQVKHLYEDLIEKPAMFIRPTSSSTSLWTVSGPFTRHTDFEFELLSALLAQIKLEQPTAVLLLGPFVDCNHPLIASGRPLMQVDGDMLPVDFVDVLSYMLQMIASQLAGTRTKVLLVPCTDDATHNVVAFPQPPLELPDGMTDVDRFVCLPNPAMFQLGCSSIAVANIDTLFDFQSEGSPSQGYSARENFTRLTAQMLQAKSFYPIVPPAAQSVVDLSFCNEFDLQAAPQVLLTPSKLQAFAHEDPHTGTVCINPGRAITQRSKMTVCKLEMQPVTVPEESTASRTKAEFFTVG